MVTVPKKNKSQVKQPVTTAQMSSVRCEVCRRELHFRPEQGTASEVLTGHYLAAGHTEADLISA